MQTLSRQPELGAVIGQIDTGFSLVVPRSMLVPLGGFAVAFATSTAPPLQDQD